MDIIEHVKCEQGIQEKLLNDYKKYSRNLPSGGLSSYSKNGKQYYNLRKATSDGYITKYIGDAEQKLVKQIQTKHFLDSSIERIQDNLKALEYLNNNYKSYNPNAIADDMRGAYQCLPEECFKIAGRTSINGWGSMPYEKSNFHPENLKHKSIKGDMVRSKSELTIVDLAFIRGYEYRYEHVLHLNGLILVPDLIIMSPKTFQPVYHEHAGLFKDEKYRNDFYKKIEIYRLNGIVPWKNLIITYDDEKGNIDIQNISRIYDIWFGEMK